jgi:hypothetical protein
MEAEQHLRAQHLYPQLVKRDLNQITEFHRADP